jgi:epsilon-lactone hydrolase
MLTSSSTDALLSASWCTRHPFSEPDQAVMVGLRAATGPNKGKLRGIEARPIFDDLISHTAPPEGVRYREGQVGGIAGSWCEPDGAPTDRAILHLHGGWFNWGTAQAFRSLVGQIALKANANAFVPDYRRAPEHPFPSAPVDASACLDGLLESGLKSVAVTGDSAGGNLALLSVLGLSATQKGRIVGVVALSPVTDLTLSSDSWVSRADSDPFFVKDQAQGLIEAYLAGHAPSDPAASPLCADLSGFPAVRVHVGEAEVLLDDALRWTALAVGSGVDARVDVWDGLPHGFIGSIGQMLGADAALTLIGAFLTERFSTHR